jgi:hypothetical protein
MSIVLIGSTSGSITLQEPAVAGSTVLDLPAVSGTILTTASSGQSIPKAALPTGSVLQVVQTSTTTSTTTSTNATWTDVTNFTASITPISSSSKVLVMISAQWELYKAGAEVTGAFKIVRGSTDIFLENNNSQGFEAATNGGRTYMDGRWNGVYLDSPATTSSTTYKLQFRLATNGQITVNSQTNNTGTVILMEIAA